MHDKSFRVCIITMCDWRSVPRQTNHQQFLHDFSKILIDWVFECNSRENPVLRWREPNLLKDIFKFDLNYHPNSQNNLLDIAKNILKFSVKTGHPYFMNQLFSGLDPYGLVGQWLTDVLNTSIYTYEVAPVLTLMEKALSNAILRMFYKDDIGDSLFCPGGSFANGNAIYLARFWFNKRYEVSPSKLVIFTSEDAHYSILKWATVCGPLKIVSIKTDQFGRMSIAELRREISNTQSLGDCGIMVFATAGTTVLGAFDPLVELAEICEKFNMWLHVDAAWGGGLIFSKKYSGLLRGIERADSITFNPHKLLAVPQQCSLLLTKHSEILNAAHSKEASYLFQKDKFYPKDLDPGDKYLQCGRKPDVLKFWFMWQAKGTVGFEKHVDHLMYLSALFKENIEKRRNFELVMQPCFINVCFWFIPPSLRSNRNCPQYKEKLHEIAPKLKAMMVKRGSLMMNYQPLKDKPNFFRFVVQNSAVDPQDIDYIINEIENLGEVL